MSIYDEQVILSECHRRKQTCEYLLANRKKNRSHWTPCRQVERAACFVMFDPASQAIGYRCFQSADDCIRARPDYEATRAKEDVTFTDCVETASVRGSDAPVVGAVALLELPERADEP